MPHFVDPRKKDSLDMNSRKNLSAEMDSPWSIESPNFINNKSTGNLLTGVPHPFFIKGRTSDQILGFPPSTLLVYDV